MNVFRITNKIRIFQVENFYLNKVCPSFIDLFFYPLSYRLSTRWYYILLSTILIVERDQQSDCLAMNQSVPPQFR